MTSNHLDFLHLNKFANFLYNFFSEQNVPEELFKNTEVVGSLKDTARYFYSEEEPSASVSEKIKNYLLVLTQDNPLDHISHILSSLKEIVLLPDSSNFSTDLIWLLHNQKQTLLSLLPLYTTEINKALSITKELDAFFSYLTAEFYRQVFEIQQNKQQELNKALEIAQIGSYTWDLTSNYISFSPQLLKILGLEGKDISYEQYMSLVHPDDRKLFHDTIEEAIHNRWAVDVEYRIFRKDNEERIVWGKGEVTYENGKARTMQGTVLDVTEKRLTELEVQYREAQLVEAQNIAQIGSFDWDLLNNKSSCTAELYRIFGWPSYRELNFSTFEKLSHPDDLEKVFLALHNAMQHKAPYDLEYRIICPDQTQKWVWARGKVTFDNNGNGIRLTGTVLDITEKKHAEEEINKKNQTIISAYAELKETQTKLKEINQQLEHRVKKRTQDLEKSILEQKKFAEELQLKNQQLELINADLDNFIYTASHDLKAPILNIEGLIGLLSAQQDNLESKSAKILAMVNTSIARFKVTIKDLTEISKVQKDSQEDIEEIKLDAVLNDVLHDIQDLIRSNAAIIETSLDCNTVRFSRKNLRSIFYNLVSNAIKYKSSDREPRIFISSKKVGIHILITIADNGSGFPADKKDKVFEMFKRFHTHIEGTGIGLYIVKRIITNAGGTIEVESEEGKGTTFRILLKN
jgi:PAS domain S-box-containing protein